MNYVSENLESMSFCTSLFNGYRKEAVDDFLRKILEDYREKEREISELKNRVTVMTETVEHYKTIEESMQHCLIIAQHTSDEMVKSAAEKAKDIISQADSTSQKLVNDAHQQANKIKFSYDDMKAKIYSFKVKSEALLKSQLDVLGQLSDEPNE